jgi:hypothetical protein
MLIIRKTNLLILPQNESRPKIETPDHNPDIFFKLTSYYELSYSYDQTLPMLLVWPNIFMGYSACQILCL